MFARLLSKGPSRVFSNTTVQKHHNILLICKLSNATLLYTLDGAGQRIISNFYPDIEPKRSDRSSLLELHVSETVQHSGSEAILCGQIPFNELLLHLFPIDCKEIKPVSPKGNQP